ncbi:helix-turn-helix domain-containing protein [Ollibium composti]|uniref:Helix-turn-helix domain-containing protein n=1 Tax=Ollibium composti TaxID=2675109 RepID=A0ABY2QEI1_9HYPH|nr:helix-turn-helix domain-containing protein [Mesorhizobium composti]THF59855.1 helix-turn-helix domain-containing protein [Mesorhizobium composti]
MTNANLTAAKSASQIPWPQKPVLPLRVAADLLGISRSSLYRLQAGGKLTFARVGGKSVVRTPSLLAYLETIEEWQ